MYMETGIIRNNKIIDNFDLYPNQDLDLYLRSHEKAKGGDDWFSINLQEEDIKTIKSLLKTEEEKKFLSGLKENDCIDILLHFTVIVKNG